MVARQTQKTLLLFFLTACAVAAAFVPLPSVMRAIIVAPLVFWLPGYGLIKAASRGRWTPLEAIVLTGGVSLAICVECGIALHLLGALTAGGWALLLGAIASLSIIAAARHGEAERWSLPPVRPFETLSLGLAVLLGVTALYLTRLDASAQREFSFTEMWLVPAAGSGGGLTLGLSNHESRPASYDVRISIDGRVTSQRTNIRLDNGETWTEEIPTPALEQSKPRWRVEALLFKDGDRETAYRKVWASSAKRPARKSDTAETAEDTEASVAAVAGAP